MNDPTESRAPRARRSLTRRALRAFGLVAALVVGLLLSAVIYLHTAAGQELLRARVERALTERMNGSAKLERLGFHLFGSVELSGLALSDATGAPVVELGSVTVRPAWGDVLVGRITLDSVALRSLRLHVEQYADGGSNLKQLFKPRPPSPEPQKKPARYVEVRSVELESLGVSLKKPDGSELDVTDISVAARFDGVPSEKTLSLVVSRIALGLSRTTKEGTRLSVKDLSTKLDVQLVRGTGKVTLGPVEGELRLERPGTSPFSTKLALGSLSFDLEPQSVAGTLEKLELGLALVGSVEVSGGMQDGALSGKQRAALVGLALKADRVNSLLGKQVLGTDIDVATNIAGPPTALDLHTKVTSRGGTLSLDGTVNAARLERPGFDLTLVGMAIATKKLLAASDAPDVEVERIELGLKGEGRKREDLAADVSLKLRSVRIGRVKISDARLRGRIERGVLTIHELAVNGLGQALAASGRYVLSDRSLSAKVRLNGDVGTALGELRRAGVPVRSQIPVGFVRAANDELVVEVSGRLDSGLTVRLPASRLNVAGGRVTLDGNVSLVRSEPDAEGKKKLGLDGMDATVTLAGVRLSSLLALRGKKLPGMDGTVSGRIEVTGTKRAPHAKVDLSVALARAGSTKGVSARLTGDVTRDRAQVELAAHRTRASQREDELLALSADVPLSGRSLAPGRTLRVKLDLPRRAVADVLELLPEQIASRVRLPPDAELEAHVALGGRTDAPRGTFTVDASARALPTTPTARQRLSVEGTLEPEGKGTRLASSVRAWTAEGEAPLLVAQGGARFSRSPLLPGGARDVRWDVSAGIGPRRIETLPLPEDRKRDLSGVVELALRLSGTRDDVTGGVRLKLADLRRKENGPFDADLGVEVTPGATTLALDVRAAGLDALRAKGDVALAGEGLLAKLRAKKPLSPDLNVDVELPRHRLSEWAALRPKLGRMLGAFGGKLHVGGSLKEPVANGALSLTDFGMADGRPGRAELRLDATGRELTTRLRLGPDDDPAPLELGVQIERQALATFLGTKSGDALLDVVVSARAEKKRLETLVPVLSADMPEVQARGIVDLNMSGRARLATSDGVRRLDDATLEGRLGLSGGTIPVPKSARKLRNVEISLSASREALTIDRLRLEESDREKARRSLDVRGRLEWSKLKPERLKLSLRAKDFLLFGTDLTGMPDAPRGALSAKIDVDGDLRGPRRRVNAVVEELALSMPERFDKAHWPEKPHVGDVFFVGDGESPAVGKLPVAAKPQAPAEAEPAPAAASGTDLFVHIARPISIQKPPFEFVATGDLSVKLRPGQKPAIEGELEVLEGAFQLGGRRHPIDHRQRSRIFFDRTHPGELDLYLALEPHPAVLQDVAKASAGGNDVRLHLTGPIGKPVSKVTGVGNADLWDILPVHNAGRVKFTSRPDMPASETVQVPREYDVVLLSYMALNLPHNLFLSRMNAWANPYDDRFSYGKIRHLEADRYSKDGKTRVRATARPPTMGQSDAELEAGYLLLNRPRTKAGAALVGGNRLGGGPALFLEWSSEE